VLFVHTSAVFGLPTSNFGSVAIEARSEGGGNPLTAEHEPFEVPPPKAGQMARLPPRVVPKTERAWDVMLVRIVEWW
jgi:hypothetical protein